MDDFDFFGGYESDNAPGTITIADLQISKDNRVDQWLGGTVDDEVKVEDADEPKNNVDDEVEVEDEADDEVGEEYSLYGGSTLIEEFMEEDIPAEDPHDEQISGGSTTLDEALRELFSNNFQL